MRIQSVMDVFAAQLLNKKLDLCAARCKARIWHQIVAKSPTLLRIRKPQKNRELHIWRARPLESIRVASPYLPRAFLGTSVCCAPPESRASYLTRAAPGIHQICEFHISHARLRAPSVSCDPSDSRAPYLPRAAPGIHQSCESHISHARFVVPIVSCDPSESRV